MSGPANHVQHTGLIRQWPYLTDAAFSVYLTPVWRLIKCYTIIFYLKHFIVETPKLAAG